MYFFLYVSFIYCMIICLFFFFFLFFFVFFFFFFFSSRRRHTRSKRDWSSDVCSSDLAQNQVLLGGLSSRASSHPGPRSNIPPLRFLRELACVDDHLQPLADPA